MLSQCTLWPKCKLKIKSHFNTPTTLRFSKMMVKIHHTHNRRNKINLRIAHNQVNSSDQLKVYTQFKIANNPSPIYFWDLFYTYILRGGGGRGCGGGLPSIQIIYSKQKGRATLWRPVLYLDIIHANHALTMPGSRATLPERVHPWAGGRRDRSHFQRELRSPPFGNISKCGTVLSIAIPETAAVWNRPKRLEPPCKAKRNTCWPDPMVCSPDSVQTPTEKTFPNAELFLNPRKTQR